MKLHNTLTRSVNTFTPATDAVSMYSCGPTVYDNIHIGNLSAFIAADTLRRVLLLNNKVHHVMNFTDIDDKTIKRSKSEFPDLEPMAALNALTVKYSNIFMDDMKAIGNDVDAVSFIRATDSIEGMKQLITELHKQGFAYITDDGVYFSIEKYRASGKKYGQLTEITIASTSEARIQNDEYDKESAHDFALWKIQKPGEPAWEFSLDEQDLTGRPGWHIECSVMSSEQLGQPFDIHTGGIDLVFPHHENEIAQSTAMGTDYARFFVHNEHLLVEGKKMSKSLNNFYTLRDIQEKGYSPLVFRLLVLQSHYRSQTNFSWDNFSATFSRLFNYRMAVDFSKQAAFNPVLGFNTVDFFKKASDEFKAALEDDLNTPQALVVLSKVMNSVKTYNAIFTNQAALDEFNLFIQLVDATMGLNLSNRPTIDPALQEIIDERTAVKEAGDWNKADELRAKLSDDHSIMLSDHRASDSSPRVLWFQFDVY